MASSPSFAFLYGELRSSACVESAASRGLLSPAAGPLRLVLVCGEALAALGGRRSTRGTDHPRFYGCNVFPVPVSFFADTDLKNFPLKA